MTTRLRGGPRSWSGSRDDEGNRTYKITFQVEGATTDGPANVLQTPGLPVVGSWWIFDDDIDLWAWCRPNAEVKPRIDDEPNKLWDVEFTFSTKPPDADSGRKGDSAGCSDQQIEDPLLEPQKVSGSFIKRTEEKFFDRFGDPIITSGYEAIKGPSVEFDTSDPQIRIEQNVPLLQLPLLAQMINTVNDRPLWGLAARCIKLSNITWERKFYGTCYVYYTRTYEFDIKYNTFDRDVIDEGSQVFKGHWNSSGRWVQDSTQLLQQIQDDKGNPTKRILDGHGRPWDPNGLTTGTGDDTPGLISVEYYSESNFLLLGIPLTF